MAGKMGRRWEPDRGQTEPRLSVPCRGGFPEPSKPASIPPPRPTPAAGASSLHHLPDLVGRGVSPLQDSAAFPSCHLLERAKKGRWDRAVREGGKTVPIHYPYSRKVRANCPHPPPPPDQLPCSLLPTGMGSPFPTSSRLQGDGGSALRLPSAAGRSFSTGSSPSPLAPQSGPKVGSGDGELDFSS